MYSMCSMSHPTVVVYSPGLKTFACVLSSSHFDSQGVRPECKRHVFLVSHANSKLESVPLSVRSGMAFAIDRPHRNAGCLPTGPPQNRCRLLHGRACRRLFGGSVTPESWVFEALFEVLMSVQSVCGLHVSSSLCSGGGPKIDPQQGPFSGAEKWAAQSEGRQSAFTCCGPGLGPKDGPNLGSSMERCSDTPARRDRNCADPSVRVSSSGPRLGFGLRRVVWVGSQCQVLHLRSGSRGTGHT